MSDTAAGPRLIVVLGPTASGKSTLAVQLAGVVGGELISADSVQVYRGLDIGSAKPSAAVQAATPHHLIDVLDPQAQADAAWWSDQADQIIAEVHSRGKRPIVVGGTGLYIRALLRGLAPMPRVDPAIREALEATLEEDGAAALHARLAEVDPIAAARLAPADSQRVIRALSIYRATGRPLSAWHAEDSPATPRYDADVIELDAPKAWLDPRIDRRAAEMVDTGIIEETARLLAAAVPPSAPGLLTLGYRAVVDHLAHPVSRDALIRQIATGHRRYAKRQRTWLRGIGRRDHGPETGPTVIPPGDNRLAVAVGALRLE